MSRMTVGRAPAVSRPLRISAALLASGLLLTGGDGLSAFQIKNPFRRERPAQDDKALPAAETALKIRALLNAGDLPGAEKLARKAVEKRPADAEAHFLLGKTFLAKGERHAAQKEFEKARELNPTYAAYGRALAELLDEDAVEAIKGDDPAVAIAAWKICLALRHKPRQTERNLAEAFRRQGEILLRDNRRAEAEDSFREAVSLLPDNPIPRLDLASLLIQDDRLQEAQRELKDLTAANPNFEEGLVAYAKLLKRMGDAREAMATVKRALALAPGNKQALTLKSELEKELPVRQEATRQSVTADEPDATLAQQLGTLENAGDLAGQANLLRKALAGNPDLVWARLRLSILCDRLGNATEALTLATEYNADRPDDIRGQFMLARARHLTGDLEGALKLLTLMVNDGKSNLQIFDELGQIYAKLGRFDLARNNWRRALEIDPEYPSALFNFGQLAMEEGKSDEAAGFFERALAIDPSSLKYRFFAGLNLKQAGKTAEAKALWQQARPFYSPNDPYTARIAAALGEQPPAQVSVMAPVAARPMPGTNTPATGEPGPDVTALTGQPVSAPAQPPTPTSAQVQGQAGTGSASVPVGTLPPGGTGTISTTPLEDSVYQTALAHARNGAYDQAEAGFREVLTRNPANLNAWINLGNVHTATEKPANAAACFLRALKLKPGNQFARQALDKAYEELGLNPGTDNLLVGAETPLDPSRERPRSNPRAFGSLAKAFSAFGLTDEARAVVRIAVDENPEQADMRLLEGETLQALGQNAAAEKAYRQAIELDRANPLAHIRMGDFLAATGRRNEAFAEYQIIMKSKDSDPDSLLDVADRLAAMGMPREAQETRMRVKGMNLSEQQMQRLQRQ